MKEPSSDTMERDARLTAIYRAATQDEPPAALDDAIRAAARRAVAARPRPAGFAFGHSWRVPLSIAAVLVLSVSMVTLVREEAPELAEPPRAESPRAEPPTLDLGRKPAAPAEVGAGTGTQGFVPDEGPSKNIALKSPPTASAPTLGVRQPESIEPRVQPGKEIAADRLEADTARPAERAKRRDALADAREQRGPPVAAAEPAAQEPSRQAFNAPPASRAPSPAPAAASVLDNKTQGSSVAANADRDERQARSPAAPAPAPVLGKAVPEISPAPSVIAGSTARFMATPKSADAVGKLESASELPPEKWLERIEQLRKEGKLEEAKASLAEFRKRFPNYRLPDGLRELGQP